MAEEPAASAPLIPPGRTSTGAELPADRGPLSSAAAVTDGPIVAACLAPADPRPTVEPVTGEVHVDPRRLDLTAADAAALELALRAAQSWGGRLVAVAAGPPETEGALRQAMAVGATALRLPWPDPDATSGPRGGRADFGEVQSVGGAQLAADPVALARALAAAVSSFGPPALVVCGDRSALGGTGALPALLAHFLGAGQALGLVSLDVDGDVVVAERRLDGGWRERLRLASPAVCSVEAAGVRLRRAPLAGALAAESAPVPVAATPATGPGVAARQASWHAGPPRPYRPRPHRVPAPEGTTRERILTLTGALAAHDPPRLVGPLDPDQAAAELLDFLRSHGYLDPV